MAILTVTTTASTGAGLSFTEAVQQAMASAGADTIRFAESLASASAPAVIGLAGSVDITAASGLLTIEGDSDGDGIADVVIDAGDEHHITVQTGAELTVRDVDLIGGRSTGEDGTEGEHGARGVQAAAGGNSGQDGTDGADSAARGGDGTDGTAGEAATGAILNEGTLTLERVGFGQNWAMGGTGGSGGFGGTGGGGGFGGHGLTDELSGPVPFRVFHGTTYDTAPGTLTNSSTAPLEGGNAGNGGDGFRGGDGGSGGDGGHAAGAILNTDGATLTLIDVSFGGRLSTGLIAGGNTAYGGIGYRGGPGGNGGMGGSGGEGGGSGYEWASLNRVDFSSGGYQIANYHPTYATAPAGTGGHGGAGGTGGNGGDSGVGGAAGTIVNLGTVTGRAAFTDGTRSDGAETLIYNEMNPGTSVPIDVLAGAAGNAGQGGFGGLGGFERDGWSEVFDNTYQRGKLETGGASADEVTAWQQDVIDQIRAYELSNGLEEYFYWREQPLTVRATAGTEGAEGTRGRTGAQLSDGDSSTDVVSLGGSADVEHGDQLTYLRDLGRVGDALVFNVIRTGNVNAAQSVSWRVSGDGDNPVSGADFLMGLPSGRVDFDAFQFTLEELVAGVYDRSTNAVRVEIPIAGDLLDELPEGYRIDLIDPGAASVVLGTARASGTITDDGIAPSGGQINGTSGDDILNGTESNDEINGLDGNDRLVAMGGNDTLNGGDGNDTLNGGDGDDMIIGGATDADLRDVVYGGEGNDSVDAGYGNDLVFGQGGNDTIAGGFGVDELQGQDGDDVITGSAFSDLVFGGAGNDFVNGGFGHDRINGGAGADKVFHVGGTEDQMLGHGSDWVQDYNAAEGDVLLFGDAAATADQFQVNLNHTANSEGERSGDDDVQEAFVIYRPTGQILWALVDGEGQAQINLAIGSEVFDLQA